mmetsp:Transcript_2060/g.5055  ORF Transcript_2060/g.5055 Transcript_2060/m.5055 type:complete len:262 (-) Transcript_2060:811-1596(-)
MPRVWIRSVCKRPSSSGGGTNSSTSKRPGRHSAASSAPGRLVAPTTVTPPADSRPSISVRMALRSRTPAPPDSAAPAAPSLRLPAMASISSSRIMEGAACRARLKVSLSRLSPSPTYIEYSCAPASGMRVAPELLAAARASVVLQQPGGPCSRMPRGGVRPRRAKASLCCSGHSTACRNRFLTSTRPPMSSQRTVPPSTSAPRTTDAFTVSRAAAKCSMLTLGGEAGSGEAGIAVPAARPAVSAATAASRHRAARSAPVKP